MLGLLDSLLRTRCTELSDYAVEDDQDQYEDGNIRKKGLLQLFQAAPKFVKSPRVGVYLLSVMFHEDKVLLTNEDTIPLLEVQDDVPSSTSLQVPPVTTHITVNSSHSVSICRYLNVFSG